MLWEFTLDLNPVWCQEVWLLHTAEQCWDAPIVRSASRWLGFSEFPGSQLCDQCITTVLLSCPWFLIASKFVLIFYFCSLLGSCVIALLCYFDHH